MQDIYTPYDDIYMPINAMDEYKELKQLLSIWMESLDEADKQGFDTRTARTQLMYIKNILYRMDNIVMHIIKNKAKPWRALGISKAVYYYRRGKQFNGV